MTAGKTFRIVGLYYLCNLIFAAVLTVPFAATMGGMVGHSLQSEALLKNLDLQWVAEYLYNTRFFPITITAPLLVAAAVLYLVLSTFLAGGTLEVLHAPEASFFAGCARHFPRLLRLLLISLIFYGVVFLFWGLLAAGIDRWDENRMEARPFVILGWIRILVCLALLCVVNMIFDYAKIGCVVSARRKMFRETFRAITFVGSHAGRTLRLYFFLVLAGIFLFAVYHVFTELTGQGSMAPVVVVLVARQLFVVARTWLKVKFFSRQMALYRRATAP